MTTVFVTHDQEEALEVADEIVVLDQGRVEQVGTPDQLYDEPSSDFVMRFLGPVTELDGVLVRPHDLEVSTTRSPLGGRPGRVVRVLRVGFEVRLTVALDEPGHADVEVFLTRTTQRHLGLTEGTHLWVAPTSAHLALPQMQAVGS